MYRLVLLAATAGVISTSGCADFECTGVGPDTVCIDDDRPATLEYITETILRPSCANAQCHSSMVNTYDYRFDSIEHAGESISRAVPPLVIPGEPESSLLYLVLIRETQSDGSLPRMPYDAPLAGPDIALVNRWIGSGADGVVVVP
ncbi:MAG: hypothetical protein ABI867_33950 [Kofleriaceae bacterium]